ncbi:MAG: glycerol-3-phosphate dehydrogenase [Blastocatellia bacterium]|jgi:glycerol-3-phosphate dehydrogenase|nr:glycerol-3-phosphate dehydrogenase [Blastocatellia bacterium]
MKSSSTYDVIIIGAGINGAGIARDAATRGLRVLLLDKSDMGGGTSSFSTRLIHGGLRYLEHGELGLVRESLREREVLLRIAPHLVRSIPILIPIYQQARRGPWTIRAGMIAYDLLSLAKTLPRHRMLSRTAALQQAPGLNRTGLAGGAIYYDAQVEFAERLVLENALAAQQQGADIVTYARVDHFIVEDEVLLGVEFITELDGSNNSARGNLIINAAGPWIDQVLERSRIKGKRLIGGTKGSHVIVAPFPGAPAAALYIEAHADGRPFFIIPWNANYLIGTTDIHYEGDLDQVDATPEEIDYLLGETNRVIPGAYLGREQILYSYAGVRPLPFVDDKNESAITRRHFIRQHARHANLLSIVGGKLTTYRSLAEETVDLAFKKLGRDSPACVTGKALLPGAIGSETASPEVPTAGGFPQKVNKRLARIYGRRAKEVMELASQDASLGTTFNAEADAIAAEVVFSFTRELATTLADCLLRRTMIGLNPSQGIGDDLAAADIARKHLGWSEDRVRREVSDYRKHLPGKVNS